MGAFLFSKLDRKPCNLSTHRNAPIKFYARTSSQELIMKAAIILCFILFCTGLVAGEADHYTDRELPLEDISEQLNELANSYLNDATQTVNNTINCDDSKESELALYAELTKYFSNHTKGLLVKEVLHKTYVTKKMIGLKDSVYGQWSIFNGYLMGKKSAANSPLALTPMIRIGDHIVGTDKLEHMFGMGQIYFKRYHMKNKKLRKVLKSGIFREKTALGGNVLATGVFAYADLSANFNGMRFWNHMLQKRDDVLGADKNIGPYVKCQDGKYEVVESNPIDFRNYIDESMDESINCSKFATKSGLKKFTKGIKSIDENYSCPMSKKTLNKMVLKYKVPTPKDGKKRPISHWIINKEGNGKVSYFNEF